MIYWQLIFTEFFMQSLATFSKTYTCLNFLWFSLGHFHQIIHFRYIICFEAFEFVPVLSSLLLALKLKIKIEYFGSILNIGLMQETLASKLALPWKIQTL